MAKFGNRTENDISSILKYSAGDVPWGDTPKTHQITTSGAWGMIERKKNLRDYFLSCQKHDLVQGACGPDGKNIDTVYSGNSDSTKHEQNKVNLQKMIEVALAMSTGNRKF